MSTTHPNDSSRHISYIFGIGIITQLSVTDDAVPDAVVVDPPLHLSPRIGYSDHSSIVKSSHILDASIAVLL
jgi:hypothetical protein